MVITVPGISGRCQANSPAGDTPTHNGQLSFVESREPSNDIYARVRSRQRE